MMKHHLESNMASGLQKRVEVITNLNEKIICASTKHLSPLVA